jgi:hypothetical protein
LGTDGGEMCSSQSGAAVRAIPSPIAADTGISATASEADELLDGEGMMVDGSGWRRRIYFVVWCWEGAKMRARNGEKAGATDLEGLRNTPLRLGSAALNFT